MWPKSLNQIAEILGVSASAGSSKAQYSASSPMIHSLSTDSRKISTGEMFVAIRGETHDGHAFVEAALNQGASAAIVELNWLNQNTHLSDRCLPVPDTTRALRVLGGAFRKEFPFPVLAVGGSNGKTTTKEMLACLLSTPGALITRTHKSENGFLGLAMTLTQKSHNTNQPPKALVAEIGIDDVGAMNEHVALATPDIALLTALGPEHLAGLGSWEKAVEEELILFRRSPEKCQRVWQLCEPRLMAVSNEIRANDVVVYESDIPSTLSADVQKLLSSKAVSALSFRVIEQKATFTSVQVSWHPASSSLSKSPWESTFKVPLPGIHNVQNFALALATAALTGLSSAQLENSWTHFVPPDMRSRIVTLNKGITLYDDCYNASPASMDAAFDALLSAEWKTRHKVLVLGDMLDLGGESKSWHLKLIKKLLKIENSDLCLFGTAMYDVFKEIKTNHSQELQTGNIQLRHAGAEVNPAQFLTELSDRLPGSVVLVKGSRGMDLGRFVKSCEAWSTAQG